ncbi:hypothetical protein C7S20_02175 [Christiangramia fulva]|uniref:Uncharacterized protein n=1 Tax=Christiangramia fulva TaxID=2126553 RepID=A0A2R3Z1M5_9FLAO|nr:hypothetical protein [Christiangramia fulva]AVR44166.1 hypothetical protein C7S20_02175 [Christiangramia fulva]
MKRLLILILMISSMAGSYAQNINSYKYIIIPETYKFTKGVDQYQLNSLTKFLFEKEGFNTVMMKGKKPADLRQDPCQGLTADVQDNSGLFVTKLVLTLTDCSGEVVYKSEEGRSRAKDFKAAYHEALRGAFEGVKEMNYQYNGDSAKPLLAQETKTSEKKPEKPATSISEEEALEETKKPTPVKIATEPKAIVDAEKTEVKPGNSEKSLEERQFEYDGQQYKLKPTAQGYGLYIKNSPEPIALLLKSGSGGNFIYNSLSNQGIAYFDNQGNLVVEYLNKQTNKKDIIVYLKKY